MLEILIETMIAIALAAIAIMLHLRLPNPGRREEKLHGREYPSCGICNPRNFRG